MDYQKLAKTLLRILSVWLIAQSVSGLVGGAILAGRMSFSAGGAAGAMWSYPFVAGLITTAVGVMLFYWSDQLAKVVAE